MQDKISTEEKRVKDYTHVGGQILSFGAALAGLETRQAETAKSLREAAERELALQVKINSLQETFNRESAKVEEMKKSRAALENELAAFTNSAQKQAASIQALEAEQKKRLTDINTQLNQQTSLSERIKVELSGLQDRRAEFAQAEAQLRHWQEIEARLRGQLLDLEEKHEIMRRGLSTDESTVVMFAHDIIKRVDLIDALTARYSSQNGGDVVTQLGTLRASLRIFSYNMASLSSTSPLAPRSIPSCVNASPWWIVFPVSRSREWWKPVVLDLFTRARRATRSS